MRSCRLTAVAGTQALQHKVCRRFSRVSPQPYICSVRPRSSNASRPQTSRQVLPEATKERDSPVLTGFPNSPKDVEALAFLDRAVLQNAAIQSSSPLQKKRATLESPQELASTTGHRAIVTVAFGILVAIASEGLAGLHSPLESIGAAAAVGLAFVLADFGTGVYHWSVDNYGSGETPLVGGQIAAFQGHHQRPWTITERQVANNIHKVCIPTIPFSAAWLAGSTFLGAPPALNFFISTFIFLVCMSQQFHAWGHMKKSQLSAPVIALQEAGVLISRKAHGAHHKAPFEGNYCIVSGLWNDVLDQGGSDQGFFRRLERFVAARTGVEPRCWYEPQYEVEEQASP